MNRVFLTDIDPLNCDDNYSGVGFDAECDELHFLLDIAKRNNLYLVIGPAAEPKKEEDYDLIGGINRED